MDTTARTPLSPASGNSSKGDGLLHATASSAHAAVDRVAGAADNAARKARPAIDRAAEFAHDAVDKAASVAAPTAEWLGEQGETLMATPKKLIDGTCEYVTAHPLKSVAIALAAGLLIGRIVR
ncbi:MAG TPA: hypothetical protein VK572_17195 [Burkholderiales bacterium]|nr:hypothetical protein [Burkholderiales bacterium]